MFFCPDCHVSNRSDAKFCRKCGKSRSDLERAEVGVAVAQAPPSTASVINSEVKAIESVPGTIGSVPGTIGSVPGTIGSVPGTIGSVPGTTKSVPGTIESVPELSESVPEAIESVPEESESVPEAMPKAIESVPEVVESVESSAVTEKNDSHDSEAAPNLSVKIEEEVSLSAPPDLSSPECPSCWKALRATDKFCCWCGEPQPNRVLPFLKLCLECSTFLPEKANYCYSCGTDVGYSSRRKVKVPHELFKDEESEFFPRFDA